MKQFSEQENFSFMLKVNCVLFLIAVSSSCCHGKPQIEICLIQSFYRAQYGSGINGNGNLLRVHFTSSSNSIPSEVSFTGSCNDSENVTKFLMLKQNINGSFIVIFFWNSTNNNYVLAIRNQTLVIEHINNINHQHEFVFSCATAGCTVTTLKSVLPTSSSSSVYPYAKTDVYGNPLVGFSPSDPTTWFKILETRVCYE